MNATGIVLIVTFIGARETSRPDPWQASQGIDLEAGIIGQNHLASQFGNGLSLESGIFFKGRPRFLNLG